MLPKSKKIYLDLETTGTEKILHGIHQIAGVIEIDGAMVDTFNFKVRPFSHRAIDHEALEISGVVWEQIAMYPKPVHVFEELEEYLQDAFDEYHPHKKFTIVSYGASLDIDFLQMFFLHNGSRQLSILQDWRPVDVLALVRQLIDWGDKGLGRLTNNRLMTVCHYLGIPLNPHDALDDAIATRTLHHKLTGRAIELFKEMKWIPKKKKKN